MNKLSIAIAAIFLMACAVANAATLYVHFGNGLDSNIGSIGAPFKNLQPAIDAAADGDIIFITAGPAAAAGPRYVYYPTEFPSGSDNGNERNKAFHTDGKNLAILGGHITLNYFNVGATILSGDLDMSGAFDMSDDLYDDEDLAGNSYHVFILNNIDSTTRFDRIEIQDGNADGIGGYTYSYTVSAYESTPFFKSEQQFILQVL